MIDDEGKFFEPDPAALERLKQSHDRCLDLSKNVTSSGGVLTLRAALKELKEATDVPMIPMKEREEATDIPATDAGISLPVDGLRDTPERILRIQDDHFVSSPAFYQRTRRIIEDLKEIKRIKDSCAVIDAQAQGRIRALRSSVMKNYCEAVFTGVIAFAFPRVIYLQKGDGIQPDEETILSEHGDAFPHAAIPLYQGFLSYEKLDDGKTAKIREETNRRENANAPEMLETAAALKGNLATYMPPMAQAARLDGQKEILAFLSEFQQRFEIFCISYGV